jgi:ligand-binding sensor domain-containing protein/signal transduction histidine kinase
MVRLKQGIAKSGDAFAAQGVFSPPRITLAFKIFVMHFQVVRFFCSIWLRSLGIAALRLLAVGAKAESSDYLTDLWTSDNDLPNSSVTAIAQTPDGYLWVGTENGLARFDGVRFVNFDSANTPGLKHSRVLGLFTDKQGALWINTYDGTLTSFRDGVFTREWQIGQITGIFSTANRTYFTTHASGIAVCEENSSHSNQWQTISLGARINADSFCQDAAGVVWCLLRNGSIRQITGTNTFSLPEDNGLNGENVNCLTADDTGRIWAGTNKRIVRWNGNRFEDETPTNGEAPVNVTFLFCTSSNGLWSFANDTIRQAKDRRWTMTADSWRDLLQAGTFYLSAYEDHDGDVWFRQFGQGLFRAGRDGTLKRLSSTNGLPDNRVSCWFQDHENNLWIGADRGGLVRLRNRQFQIVGGDSLSNVAVSTVCEDNRSNVWIGTFNNGLHRWRDGRLEPFSLPNSATRNAIFSACPDAQGRLWLSADHEDLYVVETNRISRGDATLHGIKVMLVDSQGRLWLGRQNQLTCVTNGEVSNFGARDGFTRRDVRALAEDRQGAIWIGTGNGVLYKYADGKFSSFTPKDGFESQAIWSLLPDNDGTIWAGTFRGGLMRFKDGAFTRYTTQNGLPSDVICQILDDGQGKLWIGSHRGIFSVSKNSFSALDRGQIQSLPCNTYGLYDGLPTLECSGNYQPSAWRSHDGTLWFATVKGLVSVYPQKLRTNELPPPVTIEDFLVDGKSIGARGPALIPAGRHQFEFRFTALSFTAPDKVRFRYQLSGFDNGWVEAGTRRTADYGPLPPGDYQLRVVACNNDGVWNETGASLRLTQRPFFWQTWWFKFVIVFVAVLAIAGGVRYVATRSLQRKLESLKQQRAIERERERIAKDIHDDLGAGLTQILLQSSLARRAPPDRMQTDLSQISETARDLVRTMDEIVWAINPENDNLDGLVTYAGKYAQEFLTAANLRCRLDLPPEPPAVSVSAETRHNLFLAIKEALNNVVKHAEATEVLFELKLPPGAFAFVITDNGKGFSPGAAGESNGNPQRISAGHGLKNLSSRLEAVGGNCMVSHGPGQGTRVELMVPIRKPAVRKQNKTDS